MQPWDAPTSTARTGEAGTSSTSTRVTTSAIGEASTSEITAGVGREVVEASLGTEEA